MCRISPTVSGAAAARAARNDVEGGSPSWLSEEGRAPAVASASLMRVEQNKCGRAGVVGDAEG